MAGVILADSALGLVGLFGLLEGLGMVEAS
jgi:hypothetical protein